MLVRLGEDALRPLIVTFAGEVEIHDRITPTTPPTPPRVEFRVSGTLFCEPDDHTLPGLRGAVDRPNDPARIHGRPDRLLALAYAEHLAPGSAIGQWRTR